MRIGSVCDLVPFSILIRGEREAEDVYVLRLTSREYIKVSRVRTIEYLVEEHSQCAAETGHTHLGPIRLCVVVVCAVDNCCALRALHRNGRPWAAGWYQISEQACDLYHRAARVFSGRRSYHELHGDE